MATSVARINHIQTTCTRCRHAPACRHTPHMHQTHATHSCAWAWPHGTPWELGVLPAIPKLKNIHRLMPQHGLPRNTCCNHVSPPHGRYPPPRILTRHSVCIYMMICRCGMAVVHVYDSIHAHLAHSPSSAQLTTHQMHHAPACGGMQHRSRTSRSGYAI